MWHDQGDGRYEYIYRVDDQELIVALILGDRYYVNRLQGTFTGNFTEVNNVIMAELGRIVNELRKELLRVRGSNTGERL